MQLLRAPSKPRKWDQLQVLGMEPEHMPLKQSLPVVQVWPLSNLHAPLPLHDCVAPMQAGVPLGSSIPTATFPHTPAALHTRHSLVHASLQQMPSEQKPLSHSVMPLEQGWPSIFLHNPIPSQDSVAPMQAGMPFGSSMPEATFPHAPAALHALHVPVHALSQQTPSVQKPLKQSALPPGQAAPSSPLQAPLPSQETAAPEHIIMAIVSSWPDGILEQSPVFPTKPHDLQVVVQVFSQQYPSAQVLLRQLAFPAHVCP